MYVDDGMTIPLWLSLGSATISIIFSVIALLLCIIPGKYQRILREMQKEKEQRDREN